MTEGGNEPPELEAFGDVGPVHAVHMISCRTLRLVRMVAAVGGGKSRRRRTDPTVETERRLKRQGKVTKQIPTSIDLVTGGTLSQACLKSSILSYSDGCWGASACSPWIAACSRPRLRQPTSIRPFSSIMSFMPAPLPSGPSNPQHGQQQQQHSPFARAASGGIQSIAGQRAQTVRPPLSPSTRPCE
jgi:hypothetical protein